MCDASTEARRAMRDASTEARRVMRDTGTDARSGSPVRMDVGGGDSPPPPPWMGSLLTRRAGMSSTTRNPVSFALSPPAPGPDDPPCGLPAPMYTGRPPPPPPPSAGFVTTTPGGPPPPPDGNFCFAPTPVRQDVPPGEQLPIIVRMDDDSPPPPPRGRTMRAELSRRPLRLSNLTTAHEFAAKMAEAALRTAQQARDLKAAEKRLQAARQLDAALSDQSV